MILLVCGGRDYNNRDLVERVLTDLLNVHGVDVLIEGSAAGADTLAFHWATARGIPVATVKPLWHKHGKAAGMRRNYAMIKLKPDLVVAFPGGKGTANMVLLAKKNNIRVLEIAENTDA